MSSCDEHMACCTAEDLISKLSAPLPLTSQESSFITTQLTNSLGFRMSCNSGEMAMDLHSALNNIPKSMSIVTSRHDKPYSSSSSRSTISLPPLPPNLSYLWENKSHEMGPPLPPPISHLASTSAVSSLPDCLFSMPLLPKSSSSSPANSRSTTPTIKPNVSPSGSFSSYGFQGSGSPPESLNFLSSPLDLSPTGSQLVPQSYLSPAIPPGQISKYNQLLAVIQEMGKDVRPCYAGSKSSSERLKRSTTQARQLVKEALAESDKIARQ